MKLRGHSFVLSVVKALITENTKLISQRNTAVDAI